MKFDVIAMGELLIDFTPAGKSAAGNPIFEANPGGAPGNVLAMLAKLKWSTGFIGKVGADIHGRRLAEVLIKANVNADNLLISEKVDTTLAFVELSADGEREFSFYRRPGSDTMIFPEEIDGKIFENAKIFHFGSLSLTNEPSKSATEKAISLAKSNGLLVSYDPNYRPALWTLARDARERMLWGLAECDILKVSKEELLFLSGLADLDESVKKIRTKFSNIKLLLVTDGKNGSSAYYKDLNVTCPAFLNPQTIDTTGAGDTFMGCCLHFVLDRGLCDLSSENLYTMLRFANAAASLVTARFGAFLSMPEKEDIIELLLK